MGSVRHIGIDLMGGEHSPMNVWHALIEVIRFRKDAVLNRFVFHPILTHEFFDHIRPSIAALPADVSDALSFVVCDSFIDMKDSLLSALRKKASSMAMGVDMLADDRLDSLFSTGSTAALVSLSCSRVPFIGSITRPALLIELPTRTGSVIVLDVGASVSVEPKNLVNFGRMGVAYYRCLEDRNDDFSIGLLNIGVEESKGTESHRETFRKLQELFKERFVGNVESKDVFQGKVKILVTDGFAGNVFLKTAEGVFDFVTGLYSGNAKNVLIKKDLEASVYPGSVLCGLSKLVVKGHGRSPDKALLQGISGLIERTGRNLCDQITDALS